MEAKVTWQKKMSFVGTGKFGLTVPIDTSIENGGDSSGFSPMELLLVGLAGCTAMDVISILEKKRQKVSRFEVRVNGERASEHPKVFTNIVVEYIVGGESIDRAAVDRAVELSETKYCSAMAIISKTAKIERKIVIEGAEIAAQ
ncbi:MAG TPA: OsmC family protein [Anaerolineaceae bacterium]